MLVKSFNFTLSNIVRDSDIDCFPINLKDCTAVFCKEKDADEEISSYTKGKESEWNGVVSFLAMIKRHKSK